MQRADKAYETLSPVAREVWREWLAANHSTAPGVWLVLIKKNSGLRGIGYEEAVEEALCFGWIDSKQKPLDAERMMLTFTPRKPGGSWARSNKERVARLIEQGRMTPAGMAAIEQAQADGSWNALDGFDDLTIPEDLAAAFAANEAAARNFAAFSPGAQRTYLWWIKTAKRPETRARRIEETVRLVAQNIKNPQPMTGRNGRL
jgi:uncharacterized protein YdeI (YjbR/CyaY-like superfamily)